MRHPFSYIQLQSGGTGQMLSGSKKMENVSLPSTTSSSLDDENNLFPDIE
jgi:hypothetical protein